ncbi:MAG: hypothetical protein K6T51_08910 [Rubrobacteraceae bacterium]|uniref:hypothetical protein n=1 Tax=Rubrobacter naiadicus TaxID=1392641 RepID=UPI00235E87BC|nr:hypothetical protein [Rubrobacter naiadicus]MBX6763859.1 hypothetical protein [Rubrobacteraceae bacterium]MCL6438720.1 hypothetical protein [Rubrobacteraceae bacterium]
MQGLERPSLEVGDERAAWEGLASSCVSPVRRLAAAAGIGVLLFILTSTLLTFYYSVFGIRYALGELAASPYRTFYVSLATSIFLSIAGYGVWLARSLRSYSSFAGILRRGGLDPQRPTLVGLRAYSDEQLLALRSRYERSRDPRFRRLLERTFGFHPDDSFSLAPLNVRPGTFEMSALRVEWEAVLILEQSRSPAPRISWWTESRKRLLPRQAGKTQRLLFALSYTLDSVQELKRRYGYRTERWPQTIPEGKLFDALRDYEEVRYIRAALNRRR